MNHDCTMPFDRLKPMTPHILVLPLLLLLAIIAAPARGATALDWLVTSRLGLTRYSLQDLYPVVTSGLITCEIAIDGQRVTVELAPAPLRSPEFKVLAQQPDGALREVTAPEPASVRGVVDGLPGAVAGGTVRDGRMRLTLALADGRVFFVQPVEDLGPDASAEASTRHVVYLDDPAAATGTCSVTEAPQVVAGAERGGPSAQAFVAADLAFDADFELYTLNGSSVDATVLDIENVMSSVNVIYNRDCGIQHRIVRIIVRSAEPDPYTGTDPESLLTQLHNHWNASQTAIARDIVHLMTGRNLDGGTIGIANVGVVCNRTRAYGLSQTRFTSNLGRRAALTAHELGHNWNASHCDGTNPCNIMCSAIDGCDGIGLPNFEPLGADAIKAFAVSRTCLDSPNTAVTPVEMVDVRLSAPRPSPFGARAGIAYSLGAPAHVRLGVYDVTGKRVATLADGIEAAGSHTREWNGTGAGGRALSSGVFMVRLEAGGAVRTQKLVLVR